MQHDARTSQQAHELALAIGVRVRRARQARRWTLDQLAEVAGVSRRMLVNVEQGAVNPSVGTLLRISDALGIGLPALVEPPQQSNLLKVTRRGEGAPLWSGESGGRGVLVAGTEPPDVVELWDWTLMPGESHTSDPHTPGTHELLHVHEGAVTLTIVDQTITLAAGDAMSFRGEVVHTYANRGDQPARFSLAVYEPGVGMGLRREPHDAKSHKEGRS